METAVHRVFINDTYGEPFHHELDIQMLTFQLRGGLYWSGGHSGVRENWIIFRSIMMLMYSVKFVRPHNVTGM